MALGSKVEAVIREADPLRHLRKQGHDKATGTFGSGGFGAAAESAARFFGTPGYIVGQTIIVALWVAGNTAAPTSTATRTSSSTSPFRSRPRTRRR